MKMRTLIIDDEGPSRKLIRQMLVRETAIDVIGECENGMEAVEQISTEAPDLVFLDVQMPELNGFEVLSRIARAQMPIVLFVTAFDRFALSAFEAHALDYLLKPVDEERFYAALDRAKTYFTGRNSEGMNDRLLKLARELTTPANPLSRLMVKSGDADVFLKTEQIDWIEATGNYVSLHVAEKSYLLRGRLNELEKQLDPQQFFRLHRSTIVNLDHVREFKPLFKGEGTVVLKNGTCLSASRSCSQRLRESLSPKL